MKVQPAECLSDAEPSSTRKLVGKLFAAFVGIYGDKWAKQFDSDDMYANAISQWIIALRDYTEQEIGLGVDRCRNEYSKYESLPSIARFKFLAKGLIDSDKAFELALCGDYKMKAIKSTVYRIGKTIFNKMSEVKAKERFKRIYGIICDDIIAGNDVLIPDVHISIERKQSHPEWLAWVGRRLGDNAYNAAKEQIELYNKDKVLYVDKASDHGLVNYAKMICG